MKIFSAAKCQNRFSFVYFCYCDRSNCDGQIQALATNTNTINTDVQNIGQFDLDAFCISRCRINKYWPGSRNQFENYDNFQANGYNNRSCSKFEPSTN